MTQPQVIPLSFTSNVHVRGLKLKSLAQGFAFLKNFHENEKNPAFWVVPPKMIAYMYVPGIDLRVE